MLWLYAKPRAAHFVVQKPGALPGSCPPLPWVCLARPPTSVPGHGCPWGAAAATCWTAAVQSAAPAPAEGACIPASCAASRHLGGWRAGAAQLLRPGMRREPGTAQKARAACRYQRAAGLVTAAHLRAEGNISHRMAAQSGCARGEGLFNGPACWCKRAGHSPRFMACLHQAARAVLDAFETGGSAARRLDSVACW